MTIYTTSWAIIETILLRMEAELTLRQIAGRRKRVLAMTASTLAVASLSLLVAACSQASPKLAGAGATLPDTVDYNFHVRPILSDKCFACHGPDAKAREGDLRLDLADSAYHALPGDPERYPVVPGK